MSSESAALRKAGEAAAARQVSRGEVRDCAAERSCSGRRAISQAFGSWIRFGVKCEISRSEDEWWVGWDAVCGRVGGCVAACAWGGLAQWRTTPRCAVGCVILASTVTPYIGAPLLCYIAMAHLYVVRHC
jgi:hypothetical protein